MDKLNIGYIHGFNSHPPMGGAAVHVFQITSRLIKKGFKIHTFNYEQAPKFIRYDLTLKGVYRFIKSIDILYIRLHGNRGIQNEFFSLIKLLRGSKIPLVWEINAPAIDEKEHIYLKSLEELAKKDWLRYIYYNLLLKLKYKIIFTFQRALAKFLSTFVDASVCVSEPMVQYSKRELKIKNSFLVPNGSDCAMFTNNKKIGFLESFNDNFKVVWAGSSGLSWQDTSIINAIAKRLEGENIIFLLLDYSQKQIKPSFKKVNNIIYISGVSYLDFPNFLKYGDCAICFYKNYDWTKWGFYGSPLKLYDYMAVGIPVIGSKLGQIADVIEDGKNGFLTDNHAEDIIRKINFLKQNPQKATEMGLNAKKSVLEYYNWGRAANETAKIIEDLVGEREK